MKTLFIALRAAIFGSGFIFLWGWVALGLHNRYDTSLGFALAGWTRVSGVALMAAGGTLAFACIATFVTRGEGTPAPFDPPRKFVAAGPYQFVRNPMYIGGFFSLFRFRLYEESPPVLLFPFPWLLFSHPFFLLFQDPLLPPPFGRPSSAHSLRSPPSRPPPLP